MGLLDELNKGVMMLTVTQDPMSDMGHGMHDMPEPDPLIEAITALVEQMSKPADNSALEDILKTLATAKPVKDPAIAKLVKAVTDQAQAIATQHTELMAALIALRPPEIEVEPDPPLSFKIVRDSNDMMIRVDVEPTPESEKTEESTYE